MITTFLLPEVLRAQLSAEAQAAFPCECCGLIEGAVNDGVAQVTALHPTRNLAARADRFEIDPAQHIALLRSLRGTDRGLIGCYHSHPNGKPEPSAHDLESAGEENFIWLIAALEVDHESRIAAFISNGEAFGPVGIVQI